LAQGKVHSITICLQAHPIISLGKIQCFASCSLWLWPLQQKLTPNAAGANGVIRAVVEATQLVEVAVAALPIGPSHAVLPRAVQPRQHQLQHRPLQLPLLQDQLLLLAQPLLRHQRLHLLHQARCSQRWLKCSKQQIRRVSSSSRLQKEAGLLPLCTNGRI